MNIKDFIQSSISGELSLDGQKKFLLELNEKGFTGSDIAEMVQVFYGEMPVRLDLPGAIDLCGTGGSGLSRINTSTLNTIVLSACNVPVAKHGNKAASGRFGSFDLLESLGVNIMAEKDRLERLYDKLDLAFIFARSFHPAFKHFAQVRQELGVKTIFNILGPLLNPADPEYQIIGTSNRADMKLLADACAALGKKHVLVLNGSDGLDELTLTGDTEVVEMINGKIKTYKLRPEDFGLKTVKFSQIAGGSEAFNVQITNEILNGQCKTEHINLVLANVALSLKFMGKVSTYPEGVKKAREIIDSGLAKDRLDQYSQLSHAPDILLEITDDKEKEIEALKKAMPLETIRSGLKHSERDFRGTISTTGSLNLIAEIKKGSPSQSVIFEGELNPADIAMIYEQNGAGAISVLTDGKYFSGSYRNLEMARKATTTTPILMKDFFIDPYQIYLARYYGADAVLLIVAILTEAQIRDFMRIAESLRMDCLVEVHSERELRTAIASGADIIGVNNRDLHTMDVNTKTFLKIRNSLSPDVITVAESGYSLDTASRVSGLANAVLMGTAIMREPDTAAAVRRVTQGQKLFKACGIRTRAAAAHCESIGVDLVGLNFVPTSKRLIDREAAREILTELRSSMTVGVFQDQPLEEVNEIAADLDLDFVQLSGIEDTDYCSQVERLVIKTIKKSDLQSIEAFSSVASMFIIDGSVPGSGESYDYSALDGIKTTVPVLVAGGVSIDNAESILLSVRMASGLDVASGIEEGSEVSTGRVSAIHEIVKKVHYEV